MNHWAMAEVLPDGSYLSESCALLTRLGADCCEKHCPNDYGDEEE